MKRYIEIWQDSASTYEIKLLENDNGLLKRIKEIGGIFEYDIPKFIQTLIKEI